MNAIDILIILVITFFVYKGAKQGMVEELLGVTGWVLAILFAIKFGDFLSAIILRKVPRIPKQLGSIIAFIFILIAVRVGFQAFAQYFEKIFSDDLKNRINKLIGAFFGFIKGAFFISVIALAIYILPLNQKIKDAEHESVLFGHMTVFAQVMVDMIFKIVPQIENPLDHMIDDTLQDNHDESI
jgi:membrane protein required for colicin V production